MENYNMLVRTAAITFGWDPHKAEVGALRCEQKSSVLGINNRERQGGAISVNGDLWTADVTRQTWPNMDCGSTLSEVLILGDEGG